MALFVKIDSDFEQLRASTVLGHNGREVGGGESGSSPL
jgi:hypothetical protein